jgi:hypothetical protein
MWHFIIIFLIMLLLYFHLQFHWKTSNELDIAHISVPDKDTLETIADLRQPFIMDRESNSEITNIEKGLTNKLNIMRNNKILEVPHKILLSTLNTEAVLSLNNQKFLKETDYFETDKKCKELSIYLKPFMTCSTYHDILFGSKGITTTLKRHINYRNFLYVLDGDIEIKLVPPKFSHYLEGDSNDESKLNVWEREKMLNSSNIDTILVPLKKGSLIYLPAYWWYSVRFSSGIGALALFSYRTFVNTLAILPQLGIKFIQDSNTSYKIESKK